MSIVDECWSWCRGKVGWSSSRQSRDELLGGSGLIAGALVMALWGWRLPAIAQVVLWMLLAFASAYLLRRGWFKLFGPVLFYDMLCQARRTRYFLLRAGYAALMIFFLFITFLEVDREHLPEQKRYLRMAESFFVKFMTVQFVVVGLLTPAYVAGAISDEKERGTLQFMLATDLRNREIVLSKLLSRLANLTLLILTGLPILSFLQFLGGIDPNMLLAGFLATFMTMVSLASFSIYASVHFKKSRDAIVISYLAPLVYIALGWFGLYMKTRLTLFPPANPFGSGTFISFLVDIIDMLNAGHLPIALFEVLQAIDSGRIEFVLGPVLRRYVLFHGAVALIFAILAVLRLRVVALAQANDTPQKTRLRQSIRPAVWDSSLLWKEIFVDDRARSSWLVRVTVGILVLLSITFIGQEMLESGGYHGGMVAERVAIIGTLVACLAILAAAVRAAACIAGERDKNTFDFLLTTPLHSDAILHAKFLGCLLSLRRPLLWLGVIWGLGIFGGTFQGWELIFLLVPIVIYASVFIALGLWFSMVSPSTMRATVFTILSALGISLGHWIFALCCLSASGPGGYEPLFRFQAAMTPPFVIGFSHVAAHELRHYGGPPDFGEMAAYCFVGLFLYTVVGIGFWTSVVLPRFRQITNREDPLRDGLPLRRGHDDERHIPHRRRKIIND